MAGTILMIIIILLIVYIVTSCVRIVPQAQAYVIERLGAYNGTWSVGMHFKVPFIDRVAKKVLLKEQVVDFAPQPVITKDNVTMRIDTVVYYQITCRKVSQRSGLAALGSYFTGRRFWQNRRLS